MASTVHNPPLSYEASATTCHPSVSPSLPPEVVACLQNSRFLHLATCDAASTPHISLMSYTYLPRGSPFGPPHPTIIMTTNPSSRKSLNLLANPRVSLLVHDWVSHRPPTLAGPPAANDHPNLEPTATSTTATATATSTLSGAAAPDPAAAGESSSPPPAATSSSLASLLVSLNTSALSSISTTITGEARVLDRDGREERWCKDRHRENNTFAAAPEEGPEATAVEGGDEEDADVRVVAVCVKEGRIADWKGGVRDWVVAAEGDEQTQHRHQHQHQQGERRLPNGVPAS